MVNFFDKPLSESGEELLLSMNLAFWELDVATGSYHCTPLFTRLTGLAGGRPEGRFHRFFVVEEDYPEVESLLDDCLDGGRKGYDTIFRLRRPDGSVIWVKERVVAGKWQPDGRPGKLAGMVLDVTREKNAADALQTESKLRQSVAVQAGLGGWDWDVANDFVRFDDDYQDMLGYDAEEMNGAGAAVGAMLLHPDDIPEVRKLFGKYIARPAGSLHIAVRLRHKNGHYIWAQDIGTAVDWDAEGRATRIIGGVLNIDNRVRVEQQLRKNLREAKRAVREMELANPADPADPIDKVMFKSSPHISLLFDEHGRLVDCNRAAINAFGAISKGDLLGNFGATVKAWIPVRQADGSMPVSFEENFRLAMTRGISSLEADLFIRGRRLPFDVTCKRITSGNSQLVGVYLTDISHTRDAQSELRKQQDLLHTINEIAAGLVAATPEMFDEAVQEAMRMIGRAADVDRLRIWRNFGEDDEMHGREIYQWAKAPQWESPFVEKIGPSEMPFWWKAMAERRPFNARASEVASMEQALLEANNVLSILAIPIFIRNRFWGFIGFDDCTTGRIFTHMEEKLLQSCGNIIISALLRNEMTASLIKAREEALASARAKSDFLSRMSHEIRTPMNAIIGMSSIAKKSRDVAKISDCLLKIETSSRQLLGIINDVLDMSKIEADKLEIHNTEFDFEKTLRNIFTVMQVKFTEKRQTFHYAMDAMLTRHMVADELRLSQVLLNLISNAVKFTPEEGVIILSVHEKHKTENGSIVHVEVVDNGIGIAKESIGKLFQSFEQADGGITRQYGGTGLGLAISKRIINLMGGDIWVESQEGMGASFIFEIPVSWGSPLHRAAQAMELKKNLRVLAVDGEPDALVYLGKILARFGMSVETASEPERAVEFVRARAAAGVPYDVIFAERDMALPDGEPVAAALNRLAADSFLVVMLPVSGDGDGSGRAAYTGQAGVMQKPILPSVVYDLLVQHADRVMEPSAQLEEGQDRDWNGKHILLAEDIAINREIVMSLLSETGVTIDAAEDGREAVDAFRKSPEKYDLILMDMQMPNLDGLSATREIRGLDLPGAKNVPIVAMTANAFKEDKQACLEAGMNGYIAKPVEVGILFQTLSAYLDDVVRGRGAGVREEAEYLELTRQ